MIRRLREAGLQSGVALAAVLLALAAGGLVILANGHNPLRVYRELFANTLGKPIYLGGVIFKATTLAFTGVAAAFAFRAGIFNIGGEGQLYMGAFACALAGLALPAATPAPVAVPLLALAAAAGGALAAAPPAILKATRGTHEVINTLMMNFVLFSVIHWLLAMVAVERTSHTPAVLDAGRLPLLSAFAKSMLGSQGNLSGLFAVAACSTVAYLFARTRLGYELRAVGANRTAAQYGGVSIRRMTLVSLLGSGALAGLGGTNLVLGSSHGYFEAGFSSGQGYLGIAVALLARNNAFAVLPAAFLFAVLSEGGQVFQRYATKELGEILQALVIVLVVVSAKFFEGAVARFQRSPADA
ncbi:MAG: ABC transporter permease [Planctomycetes bacterium]|nr:ABC transporter permease [Planctomycetota bacterium]